MFGYMAFWAIYETILMCLKVTDFAPTGFAPFSDVGHGSPRQCPNSTRTRFVNWQRYLQNDMQDPFAQDVSKIS